MMEVDKWNISFNVQTEIYLFAYLACIVLHDAFGTCSNICFVFFNAIIRCDRVSKQYISVRKRFENAMMHHRELAECELQCSILAYL